MNDPFSDARAGEDDAGGPVEGRAGTRAVAFQGARGAYGDLAIDRLWGEATPRQGCRDFAGVLAAVQRGEAGAGVLPVHNAIVGDIPGVDEAIRRSGLRRVGEVTVPVRHCLLALPGSELGEVRLVFSHPVALAQCGAFFARHPHLRACESYDTAGAAREVAARRSPTEGAIAAEGCAARYGLVILARDVGDRLDNWTRFAVVVQAGAPQR